MKSIIRHPLEISPRLSATFLGQSVLFLWAVLLTAVRLGACYRISLFTEARMDIFHNRLKRLVKNKTNGVVKQV